MNDAEYEAARSRLEQIADALCISVATFLAPTRGLVTAAMAAEQEEELLQLFRKVRDVDVRKRLLNYMRATADKAVA